MIKSILLLATTIICLNSNAQTPTETAVAPAIVATENGGPKIVFESETIDYGTIEHNADGVREFKFSNKGNEPLVIQSARGSCGCTVPTWPKEPINPGESAVISVKYATNRVGNFTKTVTLTTNEEGAQKVLTIKGNVLPDPPAAGTDSNPDSPQGN